MKHKKTAIYALTAIGADLGRKLRSAMDADLCVLQRYSREDDIPFERLSDLLQDNFHRYKEHVFICACGIAVRAIAPLLVSKLEDPAVVVLDQAGKHAVSLVSGHIGGANDLALRVAELVDAEPVISTATDVCGKPSVDMLAVECGLSMGNPEAVRHVNASILDGEQIDLFDPQEKLRLPQGMLFRKVDRVGELEEGSSGVYVGVGCPDVHEKVLRLHPKVLCLGIGCRRGTPASLIMDLLQEVFAEAGLSLASVYAVASIELKSDEVGILEVAKQLKAETFFYSASELEEMQVDSQSDFVRKTVGASSVCEAAALKCAGGRLVVNKKKNSKATMAVAVKC